MSEGNFKFVRICYNDSFSYLLKLVMGTSCIRHMMCHHGYNMATPYKKLFISSRGLFSLCVSECNFIYLK